MNLEHPPAIMAIIGDMMFLDKQEEGEYVGNVIFVDIYSVGTKISNIVGRHNSPVAVNLDGMCSWANIVDVSRVGEKINRALAIEEEEVWVNGGATAVVLSNKNDTGSITAYGGVIRLSRHGMNLRRRLLVWTDKRSMPQFTACAAADVAVFGRLWRRKNGTSVARGGIIILIGSWFLAVLGKDQRFVIHFNLVSGSRWSTRSAWSLRLQLFEGLPAIKKRKAVVNGLGITIITVPILILEISPESTKMLAVCPLSIRAARNSSRTVDIKSAHSASIGLAGLAMRPSVASSLIRAVRKVGTTPTTPTPPYVSSVSTCATNSLWKV